MIKEYTLSVTTSDNADPPEVVIQSFEIILPIGSRTRPFPSSSVTGRKKGLHLFGVQEHKEERKMLPRHLRKVSASALASPNGHAFARALSTKANIKPRSGATAASLAAARLRAGPSSSSSFSYSQNVPLAYSQVTLGKRSFHSSQSRRNELPKSPFQTFVDTLKEELQKNRELQENVKQLQGDVDKFQDSEAMKRARAAYERARLTSSIKENPKLRAAAEELKRQGVKVGDAVGEALRTMEESEIVRAINRASSAVSQKIASSTEPIRNTEAYKAFAETVLDALDDSGSAKHAGFEEKEARRKRRQVRLEKAGKKGGIAARSRVVEDPNAGSAMVLHKDSPRQERWNRLKETNPILRQFVELRQQYDESENPLISSIRSVTSTIGSWFDETEHAQVIRQMKLMDPMFDRETFERELREYIVPEVVDAYLSADRESLRQWCGEAAYNLLWATMEQYVKIGLVSDSKVLDIRQVDITSAKMLDKDGGDIPVFVVTFSTQERLLFRKAKTGEVAVGAEDKVEQCNYAAVLTRVEEELDDELTGGWKVVEMARRSARGYL